MNRQKAEWTGPVDSSGRRDWTGSDPGSRVCCLSENTKNKELF